MMSTTVRATLLACTFAMSGMASAVERIIPPAVPLEIELSSVYKPFLWGHAVGTQNYICAPAAVPSGAEWLFLGPQATVFDAYGEQVLTHFLSKNPWMADALHATLQHSKDSSGAWGKKLHGSTHSAHGASDAVGGVHARGDEA